MHFDADGSEGRIKMYGGTRVRGENLSVEGSSIIGSTPNCQKALESQSAGIAEIMWSNVT